MLFRIQSILKLLMVSSLLAAPSYALHVKVYYSYQYSDQDFTPVRPEIAENYPHFDLELSKPYIMGTGYANLTEVSMESSEIPGKEEKQFRIRFRAVQNTHQPVPLTTELVGDQEKVIEFVTSKDESKILSAHVNERTGKQGFSKNDQVDTFKRLEKSEISFGMSELSTDPTKWDVEFSFNTREWHIFNREHLSRLSDIYQSYHSKLVTKFVVTPSR